MVKKQCLVGLVQSLYFDIKLEFSYKVLVTATTHVKVMDFSKSHPVKIKVVRVSHYTSYFFSTINVYQKH